MSKPLQQQNIINGKEPKKSDIEKAIRFAMPSTKKLILAGINSNENFPELFYKYKFFETTDYNTALIILAFYTYCKKSKDSKISNAFREHREDFKNVFEQLKKGDGKQIHNKLASAISDINNKPGLLKLVLQSIKNRNLDDNTINGKMRVFLNQVKKISPWWFNKKSIKNLSDKRINKLNKAITPDELKETFNTALSKDNLKELEKQFKYTSAENLTEFLKAPLDDNANTALHLAVLNKKPKLTELLIKNGADPYAENTSGTYPLMYAAMDIQYKDIFYILLNGKFIKDPIIRETAEKSGIWPK